MTETLKKCLNCGKKISKYQSYSKYVNGHPDHKAYFCRDCLEKAVEKGKKVEEIKGD